MGPALAGPSGEDRTMLNMIAKTRTFEGGKLVMTRGVNDWIADSTAVAKGVTQSIKRHFAGDWGDLGDEDKQSNEWSLLNGERIFSAYHVEGKKIWIITERDRSATTVLFPDEY